MGSSLPSLLFSHVFARTKSTLAYLYERLLLTSLLLLRLLRLPLKRQPVWLGPFVVLDWYDLGLQHLSNCFSEVVEPIYGFPTDCPVQLGWGGPRQLLCSHYFLCWSLEDLAGTFLTFFILASLCIFNVLTYLLSSIVKLGP